MSDVFKYFAAITVVLVDAYLSESSRADTFGSGANSVSIDFVTVGSPGNAPDVEGNPISSGAVDYVYRISTHEISEQMIDNAVADAGLDINFGPRRGPDKPVTGVNWVEAALFVNWLNARAGAMPAYKITPPPPPFVDPVFNLWAPGDPGYDSANPYRNKLARYFLPTGDEWYKAAYFNPVTGAYFDFPIGRHAAPQSVSSGTDAFTAVFNRGAPADVTQAGGLSPFGTMGQGGNVFELVETAYDRTNDAVHETREFRGGYWQQGADDMKRFARECLCFGPYSFGAHIGFRVAAVPDPGLPGDFNIDGQVDAADYVLRQKIGTVGPEGYDEWRANFGAHSALASSQLASVVPEPGSLSLAAIIAIALAATSFPWRGRRKAS